MKVTGFAASEWVLQRQWLTLATACADEMPMLLLQAGPTLRCMHSAYVGSEVQPLGRPLTAGSAPDAAKISPPASQHNQPGGGAALSHSAADTVQAWKQGRLSLTVALQLQLLPPPPILPHPTPTTSQLH